MSRVVFTGDVICTFWDYKNNSAFDRWFLDIEKSLDEPDWVIANLETPVAGEKLEYTHHKYSFNTPSSIVNAMKNAGFNLVATANNHCLDRGIKGLVNTVKTMDRIGIRHTGTFLHDADKKYDVINIGEKKVGVLSVTYGTNAQENHCYLPETKRYMVNLLQMQELSEPLSRLLWNTKFRFRYGIRKDNLWKDAHNRFENDCKHRRDLEKIITRMKKECQYSVVLMHAGGQFESTPADRTRKWMQWFDDQDVDLVIGNHEHLVSSVYIGRKMLGFYSLGDLTGTIGVTQEPYGVFAEASIMVRLGFENGISLTFSVYTKKRTENGDYVPVSLYDEYQEADEKKKKVPILVKLTYLQSNYFTIRYQS